MKWIQEACSDDETQRYSSTRIAVLISSATLAFSTVLLSFAVLWKPDLVPALSVAAGGLAGMSGGSYMAQRLSRPKFTDRGMHD